MGRRKRRVIKKVKRQLPTIFNCPSCGEEAVKVTTSRNSNATTIQCGVCGLRDEFEVSPYSKTIDAYCKFADRYLSGDLEEPS